MDYWFLRDDKTPIATSATALMEEAQSLKHPMILVYGSDCDLMISELDDHDHYAEARL
jgi:hypothetical protein